MKGINIMSKEQIELLYQITRIHLNQFYLAMKDRWDSSDYTQDNQYTRELREAEEKYVSQYGELPTWQYHDDVVKANKEYKAQLDALETDVVR